MQEVKQELLRALIGAVSDHPERPWGAVWFRLFDCDPYRTQEIPIMDSWSDTVPDAAVG